MHLAAAILALAFVLPKAPDPTLPPAGAHAQYTVVGEGVQVYRCAAVTPATFGWIFQQPRATLFDTTTKLPIGKHAAGPTWTWNDASRIVGKLLATRPSPNPGSIPWLLLATHSTGATGALSSIKFVRRSNTQAGAAPSTGCDASHQNNTVSVPYEATYTFYSVP